MGPRSSSVKSGADQADLGFTAAAEPWTNTFAVLYAPFTRTAPAAGEGVEECPAMLGLSFVRGGGFRAVFGVVVQLNKL